MEYRKEYYKESVEISFEYYNIQLDEKKLDSFVDDLIHTIDLESQATGTLSIPSYSDARVEQLKKELKKMEEENSNYYAKIIKNIARERNVEERNVSLDKDGKINIRRWG